MLLITDLHTLRPLQQLTTRDSWRCSLLNTRFLLVLISSLSTLGATAQHKVTGIVKGSGELPLEGVTINIKNNIRGTVSNSEGYFSIAADKGNLLTLSYVGYQSKEITVASDSLLQISLLPAATNLDEIVVTGYQSEKVKEITGSVSIVKPKELVAVPAAQVEPMLQGRVAGMNVITQALPGAETLISIHGYGNFGDVRPLYIIDGIPGNINDLNPYDIESLQVLKDAGSAAIYGVRGANGVIIITTRKGKPGKLNLQYENYFGLQLPLKNSYDLLNPQANADAMWQAYKNAGLKPESSQYGDGPSPVLPDYILAGSRGGLFEGDPAVNPDLYNIDPGSGEIYQIVKANKSGTDWFHELFKPALSQNHVLSASGGSNKSSYLFSVGYLNQQGTSINTYFKKYTIRVNTEFNLGAIRIGENLQFSATETPDYSAPANPDPRSSGAEAVANPLIPTRDIKNNWILQVPELGQPAPVLQREESKRNKQYNWINLGNIYAELDFAKYLTLRTNFGGSLDYNYYYVFQPREFGYTSSSPSNSLREGSGYNYRWSWQNTLAFRKIFRHDHSVKILLGTEFINAYGRGVTGTSVNLYTDDPNYSYLSNGSNFLAGSQAATASLYSLFTRLDYGYHDKYLLTATLRRDGSSIFGPENRYGLFPSISVAWRLSKEIFVTEIPWLTDLKLRASWGKLGFDGNTSPINQYSLFGGSPSTSNYDIRGTNTNTVQGFRATNIGNAKTGWQTDISTNIGIDGVLWNGMLSFSADWYIKKSSGLLFPLALPDVLGGATAPNINVGDIENRGFDLLLGSRNSISKNLKYDVSVTMTMYKNKIVKLNDGQSYFDDGIIRNQVGHPISSFYGYKIIGFFNSADDIAKSPLQDGSGVGRFRYEDANGDNKISDSDRVFFGNPNPDYTLGLNIGLIFKNFDFSTFFYGVFGNNVFNGPKYGMDFFTSGHALSKKLATDSWTPTHTNAKVAINEVQFNSFSSSNGSNSYGVEDGSYIKNKSVILGYTLPSSSLQKIHITQLRIYFQIANLFTITKYSGLDPESIGSANAFGIDGGNYPNNQKQFLVGLNVHF